MRVKGWGEKRRDGRESVEHDPATWREPEWGEVYDPAEHARDGIVMIEEYLKPYAAFGREYGGIT